MKKIIQIGFLQIIFILSLTTIAAAYQCGETFQAVVGSPDINKCDCVTTNNEAKFISGDGRGLNTYCCGFIHSKADGGGICRVYENPKQYGCGDTNTSQEIPDGATCNCEGGSWQSFLVRDFLGKDYDVCCGWVKDNKCYAVNPDTINVSCGETYTLSSGKNCICSNQESIEGDTKCCGWYRNGKCQSTDVAINDVEVTAETLNSLNPINIGSGSADLSTPGKIISRALQFFVFPIAGVILFIVLILGGFQMLAGASNSKSLEEGKQKITSALIGFILLFAAYWIAQLLELNLGIRILS